MSKVTSEDLLRNITDALENSELLENFYAVEELSPEDIYIEVDKVGKLSFPLLPSRIQKFIDKSSKAQFISEKPRPPYENFYKLSSNKLHASINQFALDRIMNKTKKSLNLDDKNVWTAHLKNALICCPGGQYHLDMHSNSKESGNKIATLVIVLPQAHIGGDMIVFNKQAKYIFSSENIEPKSVKCIGFHVEWEHKVKKVRQGYRIALTYSLMSKPENLMLYREVNAELSNDIKTYFALEIYDTDLMYLLSHNYTEDNLRWHLLEEKDRLHSSLICSAAKKLNLIFHLVMVSIHHIYPTEELIDLDESFILHFWVDSNNKILPLSNYNVSTEKVCCTKNTESFKPYKIKIGDNIELKGNEFWYRRAAIILWPESRNHFMSFMLDYENSLHKLYDLSRTPYSQKQVKEILCNAGKYIYNKNSENEKSDFQKLAEIGLYIEDGAIAISILSCFKWSALTSDIAILFAKFQTHYSIQWCINLLKVMERNCPDLHALDNIDVLIQSYIKNGGNPQIAHLLIEVQYKAIARETLPNSTHNASACYHILARRFKILQETLNACLIGMDPPTIQKIIQIVLDNPKLYPLTSLVDFFVKFAKSEDMVHYQKLYNFLTKAIDRMLKSKMQEKCNWSTEVRLSCRCKHCKIAEIFLKSSARKKVWPIGKLIREHVGRTFDKCGIPVKFSNLRRNLILIKTDELQKPILEEIQELKLYRQRLRTMNS